MVYHFVINQQVKDEMVVLMNLRCSSHSQESCSGFSAREYHA
jgi:hypothetical protein